MSNTTLTKLCEPALAATTEFVWRQWSAIGSGAHARHASHVIVDLEALLLMSAALVRRDARPGQLARDWLAAHSRLVSNQRLRNLRKHFPQEPPVQLAGGMMLKSPPQLRLSSPAALQLRMRLGLGVGIKADTMSFLLGTGSWATATEVARAIGYHTVAVRRASEDLATGRFIESDDSTLTRARMYRANPEEWRVAGTGTPSIPWGYCWERYAFLAHLIAHLETPNGDRALDPVQLGDWGKRWMEQFPVAFRFGNDGVAFRGKLEEWAVHFRHALGQLTTWLEHPPQ